MSRNKKGPTVLRDLKIKSVSVVDQGANQHAHIKLAKRADGQPEEGHNEKQFVESDAAFFARIGQAVAKMFHISPRDEGEIDKKDAQTFATIDNKRKTFERIYRISDALSESLRSIACDDDLTDEQKAGMIVETADQAAKAIKTDIAGMFNGSQVSKSEGAPEGDETEKGCGKKPMKKEDPDDPDDPKDDDPEDSGEGVGKEGGCGKKPPIKKGATDMIFDTSKMTPEEKAQFDDLAKRFGSEEPAANPATEPAPPAAPATGDDDIYKGLHPAVKAELENLRKFREDSVDRELTEVAKRYTIIGKKPEELTPMLKSLKAAGGTAYDDMIAVLDSAVHAVEKSGVFGEIGKRGTTGSSTDDAWGKIEAAAQEIVKSNTGMSYAQAIDKACTDHPDLLEAYENSRK